VLFAVALLEFFPFPIPPDLVLVPLVVANTEFTLLYTFVATAGSVTAGFLGFVVGRKGGRPALESQFTGERVERVGTYFERYERVTIAVEKETFRVTRLALYAISGSSAKALNAICYRIVWGELGNGNGQNKLRRKRHR
jgi:membrane protein DedA with SNARE-associated domain